MRVDEFIVELERANRSLSRISGAQVNSAPKRAELRRLVEIYFESVRPTISSVREQSETIKSVDSAMHALLVECHKRGQKAKYKRLLNSARGVLVEIDALEISQRATAQAVQHDHVDARIIDTLKRLLPTSALAYMQALDDLKQEQRFSWRGAGD